VIFTKSFQAYVKDTDWKLITNAYVKIGTPTTTPGVRIVPDQTIEYTSLGLTKATVPPNVFSITVTGHGGGGGGGGADGGSNFNGGGGGGGGANRISQTFAVTPGQVLDITVGRGGAGGGGPYGTGGAGQPSTVTGTGVSFTAGGGGGGTGGGNSGTGFGGIGANGANYTSSFRVNAGGTSTNGGANGGNGGATKNAAGQAGQHGKVFISYTPTPIATVIRTGGWKQIIRGWLKHNGVWENIATPLTLESSRVATTPSTRARINIVIASNTTSYNLLDTLNSLGTYYPGYSDITLTVNAGVVVDSDSAGGAALTVDGLTSGDSLIIVNNGTIRGRGGAGGAPGWLKTTVVSSGKNTTTSTSAQPAYPGGTGGTGLAITYIATLENNGNIYAGGGGGGGGGISYNGTGGGQGGGGAGFGPGANAGTATTGGAGANNGGTGGSNGANGTTGTTGATITVVNSNGKGSTSVPGSAGGAGGIGGKAIAGYAKLTVTVEGTIVGPRA
jgi:hypothetical protein